MPKYKKIVLTQQKLKQLLHYDPDTGFFTRTKGAYKGNIAGSLINGYVSVGVKDQVQKGGKTTYHLAHRLAWLYMTNTLPNQPIDHLNGIRSDNRWENLQAKSQSENLLGYQRPRLTLSGVRGVYWCAKAKAWTASHSKQGKATYLGMFNTVADAEIALEASRKGKAIPPNPKIPYAKNGASVFTKKQAAYLAALKAKCVENKAVEIALADWVATATQAL